VNTIFLSGIEGRPFQTVMSFNLLTYTKPRLSNELINLSLCL